VADPSSLEVDVAVSGIVERLLGGWDVPLLLLTAECA
jgi:hypothetical protein